MGSFDATCVVSDIGISYGDKILVVPLVAQPDWDQHGEGNWEIAAVPIEGTYNDYGSIRLDRPEEGEAVVDLLRPYIVRMDQGENAVHDSPVDPATLTWEDFENLDHESRTFVVEKASTDAAPTHKDELDAHWGTKAVSAILAEAGIETKFPQGDDSVWIQPIGLPGTNVMCVELPWPLDKQDALIPRIRTALEAKGYSVMLTGAPGRASAKDAPPQKALMIAPAPGSPASVYFGRPDWDKEHRRVTRGFIRKDVFDALVPVCDEQTLEMAELLRKAHASYHEEGSDSFLRNPYMFGQRIWRLREGWSPWDGKGIRLGGLSFKTCSGAGFGAESLVRQILAIPVGAPVEAFVPFIRLQELMHLVNGHLRRGFRPTVAYVGSQGADEDLKDQARFHRTCAKIATAAIKEHKARWG